MHRLDVVGPLFFVLLAACARTAAPAAAPARSANAAIVIGTVAVQDGAPIAGARVRIGWAPAERADSAGCLSRGQRAGVVSAVTDERGRYRIMLEGAVGPSFVACVDVAVDGPVDRLVADLPPTRSVRFGSGTEIGTARIDILMVAAPVLPPARAQDTSSIQLPPGRRPNLRTPADTVPVRTVGRAPSYRAVIDTIAADLTGDGAPERIELSADAELDARGRPIFEHGHRWRVIVRSRAHGDFVIVDEFVPNGMYSIRIERSAAASLPMLIVDRRARDGAASRRLRFDPAARTFITEPHPR